MTGAPELLCHLMTWIFMKTFRNGTLIQGMNQGAQFNSFNYGRKIHMNYTQKSGRSQSEATTCSYTSVKIYCDLWHTDILYYTKYSTFSTNSCTQTWLCWGGGGGKRQYNKRINFQEKLNILLKNGVFYIGNIPSKEWKKNSFKATVKKILLKLFPITFFFG
jgi:hypothetical protein